MVKDPRSPPPRPSAPDETVELLRALARHRAAARPGAPAPASSAPDEEIEKFDSLRALAHRLDVQLRAPGRQRAGGQDLGVPRRAHGRGGLRQQWREFIAALPPRAGLVPHLQRERLIFVIVSLAVLVAASVGSVIAPPWHRVAGPAQVVPPVAPAESAPPVDLAGISKAMTDCDARASQNPDSLAFLVVPVVRATIGTRDWRAGALQAVGNAYLLLNAQDALDGLRDGSLALRPGRYTFSVLDPSTGVTYSWTSATGISRLERPNSAALKTLQIGFDFSKQQTGPQWSREFERKSASCLWVAVLALH